MIKILFVIENLSDGGAEMVLRNLVNNMNQSEFDITVMTTFPVDSKKYLAEGIKFKSLYKKYSKFNYTKYRVESALRLAYKFHVKEKYDIEVAYLECGATKIVAGSNSGAKKIAWVHCELKRAMQNPEEFANQTKKYYNKYDRVACVSKKVAKDFEELFGNTPKADVVYNVVDSDKIIDKSNEKFKYLNKKTKFTIATVGRLTTPKSYLRLLKIAKRLKYDNLDFNLWIIGDGEQRQMLETYIKENDLTDSVKMFGFQENPYPFMKAADLLVCSSIYEGFSTYITEGLILGKPIVTTECSGMRELLGDSEYGIITENSEDALYEGIKRIMTDEELLKHYEEKSIERGYSFHTDVLVNGNEQFFKEILRD